MFISKQGALAEADGPPEKGLREWRKLSRWARWRNSSPWVEAYPKQSQELLPHIEIGRVLEQAPQLLTCRVSSEDRSEAQDSARRRELSPPCTDGGQYKSGGNFVVRRRATQRCSRVFFSSHTWAPCAIVKYGHSTWTPRRFSHSCCRYFAAIATAGFGSPTRRELLAATRTVQRPRMICPHTRKTTLG